MNGLNLRLHEEKAHEFFFFEERLHYKILNEKKSGK